MALTLTRQAKPGYDTVLIGDNIRVTVIDTPNGQTRLRIEAPKEVRILREELLTRAEGSH